MLAQPGSQQNNVDVANDCDHKQVTSLALLPGKEKKILIIFLGSSPVVPWQKREKDTALPVGWPYHRRKLNPLHQVQLLLLLLSFR